MLLRANYPSRFSLAVAASATLWIGYAQLELGAPWPAFAGGVLHDQASAKTLTRESSYAWGNGSWGNYANWSVPLNVAIESTPAINGAGGVYVTNEIGDLYCLAPDGTEQWRYRTNATSGYSSPALSAGGELVYFGVGGNSVFALTADSGALVWVFGPVGPPKPALRWQSSPVISVTGAVYFALSDARIYAVDGRTGAPLWSRETQTPTLGSGALGAGGVLFMGADATLLALNASSGALLWSFELSPSPIPSYPSPAIGDAGVVFMATCDDVLFAINGTTGAQLWRQVMSTGWICGAEHFHSSPSVGRGGLVAILNNAVVGFDAQTGAERWRALMLAKVYGSPVIDALGSVYVSTVGGIVVQINGATGDITWASTLIISGDGVTATPALALRPSDGAVVLYVGSAIGVLSAFVSGCPPASAGLVCACIAGAVWDPVAFTCSPCPPGTFSSSPSSYYCEPCPPNMYAPQDGQTRCLACPPDTSAVANATACSAPPSPQQSKLNWALAGPLLALIAAFTVAASYG